MRLRHIPGSEDFIKESPDCISGEDIFKYKGNWKKVFKNENPIQIEIGMGKGKFIRETARRNPNINYIGIERYESVLMKAIQRKHKQDEEQGECKNLLFMCADAAKLADSFEIGEVDKIFLNFSDPWPKVRHEQRRLTSKTFLEVYDKILKIDGDIEFKTDNLALFEYSVEAIPEASCKLSYMNFDFHNTEEAKDNIMTEYEEKFSSKGQKICKLIARR